MVMRPFWTLFCAILLSVDGSQAGPLLVDSFDDGFFDFSALNSAGSSEQQFGTMLGGDRVVSLSTERLGPPVHGAVQPGASQLDVEGPLGRIVLTYGGDFSTFPEDPLNLDATAFNAFEFDVASLTGQGAISVVVNDRAFGSGFKEVPLQTAGKIHYPFAEINGGNFADVDSVHIWLLGRSSDFAFSLEAVHLVPEPSGRAWLFLAGVLPLAAARSNRRGEHPSW
jgi:hypothetical protein